MYSLIAKIIVLFLFFMIAPFMTISYIFFEANWGLIGDILGTIFFVLGFIHMLFKIREILQK